MHICEKLTYSVTYAQRCTHHMVQYAIISYSSSVYLGPTISEDEQEEIEPVRIDSRNLPDNDPVTIVGKIDNGYYDCREAKVVVVQSGGSYVNERWQLWLRHEGVDLPFLKEFDYRVAIDSATALNHYRMMKKHWERLLAKHGPLDHSVEVDFSNSEWTHIKLPRAPEQFTSITASASVELWNHRLFPLYTYRALMEAFRNASKGGFVVGEM